MRADIIQGNVFEVLPTIKAGSVDCAVTSPPYWFLRSYLPKDHPNKHLELGSERTPAEFVANLVRVFGLVRDCLAEHGTCWINCGDTYGGSGAGGGGNRKGNEHGQHDAMKGGSAALQDITAGNLCLIPQRLAIALQDDGWLVRSIVVWHKPSCMPASLSGWSWRRCRVKVSNGWTKDTHPSNSGVCGNILAGNTYEAAKATWADCPGCKKCEPNGGYVLRRGSWRPTSSYEPILMLAKSAKYFCDGESVKTPPAAATISRDNYTRILDDPDEQFAVAHDHETICDGANLRDVWQTDLEGMSKEELIGLIQSMGAGELPDTWRIASEPLRQKHYAAFPSELARRCLKAGTSARGYCPTCGGPWVRVIESNLINTDGWGKASEDHHNGVSGSDAITRNGQGRAGDAETKTLGWRPSCSCPPAEPRPGLVLDPFVGSGRTAIVAGELGLDFVGSELNEEYVAMARKLTRDQMPLFLEPA